MGFFAPTTTNNNERKQPDHVWKAFESSFRQTTSFQSYKKTDLKQLEPAGK